MSRKKTLLCLIWAFLLLLIPAVGASAATELQYVSLTPSEDGSQTGVIVALNWNGTGERFSGLWNRNGKSF